MVKHSFPVRSCALGSQAGFTIQEILAVLIMSSLLVSFGLSLFLSTSKLLGSWERKTELHSSVSTILQVLAQDIQKAKLAILLNDSTLVLSQGIGIDVTYRCDGASVLRNGVRVGEKNGVRLRMRVSKLEPTSTSGSSLEQLRIAILGKSKNLQQELTTTVALLSSCRREFLKLSKRLN
jgi:type II secretory pathway component PulJ